MIILLDTSTPVCRLRVVGGDESTDYEWDAGRTLARGLLGFLQEKTGDVKTISGIGIMKGPGSFTGLRIGITTANALAYANQIPITGTNGENWLADGLKKLEKGENDEIVLPEYGAAPNITISQK